ncbi:MAG TPA: hypothetical protein VE993_17765 [Stellaceae bacterium]|nr:hypothetical protein [Stellaceae bacterium]
MSPKPSPRARPGAPVATPLFWQEVEQGVRSEAFTVRTLPQRLAALQQDPRAEIGAPRQSVTAATRNRRPSGPPLVPRLQPRLSCDGSPYAFDAGNTFAAAPLRSRTQHGRREPDPAHSGGAVVTGEDPSDAYDRPHDQHMRRVEAVEPLPTAEGSITSAMLGGVDAARQTTG